MYILIFILLLAILVLVHEFGHFIAAKKNGVLVEEFGFGFPPRLFGFKKGETLYSVNFIPLGGFVKLYGEEYQEVKTGNPSKLRNRTFVYKKPWQKALIIVAGVLGNFLLGWLIISFLFTRGVPTPINKVLVENVQKNSPADEAGLKNKDLIYNFQFDGKKYQIASPNDLILLTNKFAGQKVYLFVERNKEKLTIILTPRKNPPAGQGPLGVIISTPFQEKKYSWYQAPWFGLIESFNITQKIVSELTKTLFQLLTFKKTSVDVTGPVGIARFTGQALKVGLNAVLELLAILSLNLAVINILPFPALDGGRLVFIIYEWITKKRVNQNIERYLNLVGFIILLTLAGLVTINDIIKIYR